MKLSFWQNRRAWLAGGAGLAVLIVAVSCFLVVLPKLGAASDTRAQARDNDVVNSGLLTRHGALVRLQNGIVAMRADLVAALTALPPTSALPEFTREATRAAASARVILQNISISALTPVVSSSPAPAAPAATGSATTTTPATGSGPSSATQYQISVTLTTSGPTSNQIAFAATIESGSRRALMTSTTLTGSGTRVSMTSQLNIFTAPMTDQQIARLRKLAAG